MGTRMAGVASLRGRVELCVVGKTVAFAFIATPAACPGVVDKSVRRIGRGRRGWKMRRGRKGGGRRRKGWEMRRGGRRGRIASVKMRVEIAADLEQVFVHVSNIIARS